MRSETEIRAQLQTLGFAVTDKVPGYDLKSVLFRLQAATVNEYGLPLSYDGGYGPQTERALFGPSYGPANTTLAALSVRVAQAMVGVSEVPPGSNRGPQIDLILKVVGLAGGYPWCAAFTYWAYRYAAYQLGVTNPHPQNAGVLNLWDLAGFTEVKTIRRISAASIRKDPSLLQPGDQIILDFGNRAGHTGLFISLNTQTLRMATVEGNTNTAGSREGVAVQLKSRSIYDGTFLGVIRYT